jgi:hypothetical protein
MLRMILIIFGALFVLFCLIVCYCACVVAGREDRRMEALYMEHEMKQQKAQAEKPEPKEGTAA